MVLLLASCSVPWRDDPGPNEINLNLLVENNLLYLPSLTIDNRQGRYFFGSAHVRSVFDPALARALGSRRSYAVQLSEKSSRRVSPLVADLGAAGEALVGADAVRPRAVTIDYYSGLLTFQDAGIEPGLMALFSFDGEPAINVSVDGRQITAVVDTAIPDTLILPGSAESRGTSAVSVAGTDFGRVDVRLSKVPRARIGNRLLSRFLVSIDYGRQVVGLWRDPRIPL